jgi:peptidoglycan/LPS O-acetylase OafA/YrhL
MRIFKIDNNRILGLDIVRSIAILIVVYDHASRLLPKYLWVYYFFPRPNIDGVSIFFVLSGFLIGQILLKIIDKTDFSSANLLNFWIRRWFRTLPNYFLILFLLVLYQFFVVGHLGDFNMSFLIFTQNMYKAHPLFFPEAWSLSVEEWFYLSFPILCFILIKILKNKRKAILFSAASFIIIPLILRIVFYTLGIGLDSWDANYRKVIIFRLDSVMYGILGAYVSYYYNNIWEKLSKPGLIMSILLILFITVWIRLGLRDETFKFIYGVNLVSIATLLMLPYFSRLRKIRFKTAHRFFTFISIISYSMYLINFTIVLNILMPLTFSLFGIPPEPKLIVSLGAYLLYWIYVISGSFLIYSYYERPMMNLREKFKKEKGPE